MWKNDWQQFVEVVGQRLRNDVSQEALDAEFGLQAVTWSGLLKEKLLDEPAPMVTVSLPAAEIRLGNSGSVHIGDLSVPAAGDSIAKWEAIPVGASVSFTAVLGGGFVFTSPLELRKLTSGRTLLMIRVSEGRPIAV